MINKKNIWFLTLFSLILVLSVYYITMPNDMLLNIDTETIDDSSSEVIEEVSESTVLVALRVEGEEQYLEELNSLKEVLNNSAATIEEKNNALEKMKSLNNKKSEEESLVNQIKKEYNFDSFVKIDGDQIRVVIDKEKHDIKTANAIMRLIQKNYENKMYISVKFQRK